MDFTLDFAATGDSAMNVEQLEKWSADFHRQGYLVLPAEEIPMTHQQWQQLQSFVETVNYEKVVGGDTGDAHSVWVGRFVNDVEKPVSLSQLTPALMDIVMKGAMYTLFTTILGARPLCVRRCQANRLLSGDFIGYHIDQDTTPDYFATAIFQLSDDYEGGEFCLHHPRNGDVEFSLPKYSLLLNRGDIPHQVRSVTSGSRRTLACFFSTNFGPTAKPRSQIQLADAEENVL